MTARDPKVLILCGGRGRRLGALSHSVPKPLARVGDRSILDVKIQDFLEQGLREFVLCVGYKGEMIREAVRKWEGRASFELSDAGEEAGMLKRIWHARELCGDTALITYGDTFADIDVKALRLRSSAPAVSS